MASLADPKTVLCSYRYDPLDRLANTQLALQFDTRCFYQKNRLATEIQGEVRRSLFQHADQLLAQQHRAGDSVSVMLLVVNQQRSVLQTLGVGQRYSRTYTVYGHHPAESGLTSVLGFGGQRPDPLTGHYLLGNGYRAFNPVLMRFNSPDIVSPFGRGGLNSYAYCQGDPVNRSDPTGHFFTKLNALATGIGRTITAQPSRQAPNVNRYKFFAVAGAGTAVPAEAGPGFVGQVISIAKQSLFSRTGTPNYPAAPARQLIRDAFPRQGSNLTPFTQRLLAVNENLISHGNHDISLEHASAYVAIAKQVESGSISNTFAHVSAAKKWGGVGGAVGTTGAIFNMASALQSGVIDAGLRKTGQIFRRGISPIRTF